MESKWSLGVLIGLPITAVLVLAGLAVVVYGVFELRSRDPYNEGGLAMLLGGGWLVLVLGIALSPLGFYPYTAEYHRWEPVTGKVAEIDKRIYGGGGNISEKFVVRFEGSQQEYGCEDTRCAVVDPGDTIGLSCIRVWQYSGIDGYDCRYAFNKGEAS